MEYLKFHIIVWNNLLHILMHVKAVSRIEVGIDTGLLAVSSQAKRTDHGNTVPAAPADARVTGNTHTTELLIAIQLWPFPAVTFATCPTEIS